MKAYRYLAGVLLVVLSASQAARADVCQPGAATKIKFVPQRNGRVAFMECELNDQNCYRIGPETTYTIAELNQARAQIQGIALRPDPVETQAIGMTALMLLALLDPREVAASPVGREGHFTPAQPDLQREQARQDIVVLGPDYLTDLPACSNVADLANHRAVLERVLNNIVAQRPAVADAGLQICESRDAKNAPGAQQPNSGKQPVHHKGGVRSAK